MTILTCWDRENNTARNRLSSNSKTAPILFTVRARHVLTFWLSKVTSNIPEIFFFNIYLLSVMIASISLDWSFASPLWSGKLSRNFHNASSRFGFFSRPSSSKFSRGMFYQTTDLKFPTCKHTSYNLVVSLQSR